MIQHKHLIINARIERPIRYQYEAKRFLSDLVDQIGMKRIIDPVAKYVTAKGNRGMTAAVLIETSHIAFHIWDEKEPAELKFDLYTCGSLEDSTVRAILDDQFGFIQCDWTLLDRAELITELNRGQYSYKV